MRAFLAVRLTCRKWNELVGKSRIRIPIGLMRIAQVWSCIFGKATRDHVYVCFPILCNAIQLRLQVDHSYGIFMVDSTGEELIAELMENENHLYYWLRKKPHIDYKKVKAMLRSIEFDTYGRVFFKTDQLWGEVEWVSVSEVRVRLEFIFFRIVCEGEAMRRRLQLNSPPTFFTNSMPFLSDTIRNFCYWKMWDSYFHLPSCSRGF